MERRLEKSPINKWEISIMAMETEEGKKDKVTRRFPELNIAETKILENKEKAIELFNQWLQ